MHHMQQILNYSFLFFFFVGKALSPLVVTVCMSFAHFGIITSCKVYHMSFQSWQVCLNFPICENITDVLFDMQGHHNHP